MTILVVDPVYNPNLVATITSATKLGPGITIAKFLGAYGDRTSFNHIGTKKEREAIARQLYLQAEMMRMINLRTFQTLLNKPTCHNVNHSTILKLTPKLLAHMAK